MTNEEAARAIDEECDRVKEMLLAKNKAYGNSALDPVRVFSKAPPTEQILVRLDDKLSRLARGASAGEDVILDIIGYLVLLRIARRMATEVEPSEDHSAKDGHLQQSMRSTGEPSKLHWIAR